MRQDICTPTTSEVYALSPCEMGVVTCPLVFRGGGRTGVANRSLRLATTHLSSDGRSAPTDQDTADHLVAAEHHIASRQAALVALHTEMCDMVRPIHGSLPFIFVLYRRTSTPTQTNKPIPRPFFPRVPSSQPFNTVHHTEQVTVRGSVGGACVNNCSLYCTTPTQLLKQ